MSARLFSLFLSLLAASFALLAQEQEYPPQGDPNQGAYEDASHPVARISILNGEVSVQRGDSGEVVAAALNAPLMAGDRVTTGPGARAEIQFDYANVIRLGSNADIRLNDLQANRYQLQIARGTISFSVVRDSQAQVELSTPPVSIRPVGRGLYRIWVAEDGQTEVTVRRGRAEVFSPRGAEELPAGRTMLVRGNPSDPEFQTVAPIAQDDWDQWNYERDHALESSQSYRYVSPDVYGAEDLDSNGRWVHSDDYGPVWSPDVGPDWAPYRNGRWAWEPWYGWTWVSYDPWGWAPYHYGRWFYSGPHGWCWYPGAFHERHFWSPALVAFFGFGHGGVGFGMGGFGFGGLGWVPLAPFETSHRWWGRGFHGSYGRNVFVNNVNVVNVNIVNSYRNARIRNAISGVSAADFAAGRFTNARVVPPEQARQAGLVRGQLPFVPQRTSLQFTNRPAQVSPRPGFNSRGFYSAGTPAPAPRTGLAPRSSGPPVSAWRRAGEPSPRPAPGGGGWSRFGSPAPPRDQSRSQPFGGSSYRPSPRENNRESSPAYGSYGRTQQPLQIAPPIVRERPSPSHGSSGYRAPYNPPRYESTPRYSPPAYSAPRHDSAPRYSAPSGGGGHSGGGSSYSGGGHSGSSGGDRGGGSHGGSRSH